MTAALPPLPAEPAAPPRAGGVRRERASRQRILAALRAAAITEFSLHGIKGTSAQAIAQRAGLTKPQLYYYIDSLDDFYAEVLDTVMTAWKIDFAPPHLHSPADILADYVRQKIDHAFDHPEVSRIFTREILDGGHSLARYWPNARAWVQREVDVIEGWIADGRMPRIDPHLLLMNIWAMTQHHADFALQMRRLGRSDDGAPDDPDAPAFDRPTVVRELTAFVLRGCGLSHR